MTVVNPQTGQAVSDVPMLLDSGADVTLIPASCPKLLGLAVRPAEEQQVLVGFDGTRRQFEEVEAHLVFEGRTFRGRFPLLDGPVGVMGRNVLNLLRLSLDGRQFLWNIED